MNKKKLFLSSVAGISLAFGITSNAYAKVNSYVVKDNVDGVIRNYISFEVNNSLVDKTLGKEAPLFDEFQKYFSKNGILAFHSDKGKFVSNDIISKEYIDNTLNGKDFDIDKFMENTKTAALPISEDFSKGKALGIVKNGLVLDKDLVEKTLGNDRDLYVMADNIDLKDITLKGNLILELKGEGSINLNNISCSSIKVIDAGKSNVNLVGVKTEEVKVNGNAKLKSDVNTKISKLEIAHSDKNSEVSLEGNFGLVQVIKEGKINLSNVNLDKFEVKAKIEYKLDKNVKIKEISGDQDKIQEIKNDVNNQSGQGTTTSGGSAGGSDSVGNNGGNPGGGDNQVNKIVTLVAAVSNGIEVTIKINSITDDSLTVTIEDLTGNYKYIDQIDKSSIIGGKATLTLQLNSGEYKGIVKGTAFVKEEFAIK